MSNKEEVRNLEKIAVLCKNKKEWDGVKTKLSKRGLSSWEAMNKTYDELCIYTDDKGCDQQVHAERDGYKVITAAEYLGGKDVKEFEVGDTVKVSGSTKVKEDTVGVVVDCASQNNIGVKFLFKMNGHTCEGHCQDGYGWYFLPQHVTLATKPKTTKENNMELNSSIRTVFVEEDNADYALVEKMQKVFGGEIAEDFTGAMILRDNKPKYIAEIKRLDDIEAKRLKEEAKKK